MHVLWVVFFDPHVQAFMKSTCAHLFHYWFSVQFRDNVRLENAVIFQTDVFSSAPCSANICILCKYVVNCPGCLHAVRPLDFYSLCVALQTFA